MGCPLDILGGWSVRDTEEGVGFRENIDGQTPASPGHIAQHRIHLDYTFTGASLDPLPDESRRGKSRNRMGNSLWRNCRKSAGAVRAIGPSTANVPRV